MRSAAVLRVVTALVLVPSLAAAEPSHVKIGDATLSVGFGDRTDGESLDALTLRLERKGATVWTLHGWKAIAGGAAVPPTLSGVCDTFAVDVGAQPLDRRAGARIDVACRNGEDMFTANSIAILVDTVDPYAVLWLGEGGAHSSENDACIDDHVVDFTLAGKKLTQTIVDTRWKNADGSCSPSGKRGKKKIKRSKRVIVL
jgi:hypothetical protein